MAEESALGTSQPMFFEVHPSVLFKLGEDLIRDEGQALVELIKNSYDADAQKVRVFVDTDGFYDRSGKALPPGAHAEGALIGSIRVEDDGSGMDAKAIHDGWLTISSSPKLDMKRNNVKTLRKRTPLGDKGLGRLGVQRLGQVVTLTTIPRTSPGSAKDQLQMTGNRELNVVIDWSRFDTARTLGAVPIPVTEREIAPTRSATTIGIIGLKNAGYWTGKVGAFQKEIASIVSPFDSNNGVNVFVNVNGRTVDIRRDAQALLENAPVSISFEYSAGELVVHTQTKVSVLAGGSAEKRYLYQREILPDNGYEFSNWLFDKRAKAATRIGARPGDDRYFVKSTFTTSLDAVAPTGVVVGDPGPFSGKLGSISLDDPGENADGAETDASQVLSAIGDFKLFAKSMAGIRVYRDGFGIRLEEDWLGLSKQQTSAGSWYGLRPGNTVGYINLTASGNSALEETSSREDFSDTPAWRGFRALMESVVSHVRDSQDLIRRGWNDYSAGIQAPQDVQRMESPREIVGYIGRELDGRAQSHTVQAKAAALTASLETAKSQIEVAREASRNSVWADSKVTSTLDEAYGRFATYAADLDELMEAIEQTKLAEEEVRGALRHLTGKLEVAELQLESAWESVALGLSAEALGHEVANISERLRGRSTQILQYFRAQNPIDRRSTAYAEEVRATSAELSRQAGRLDPMLRYRRERREVRLASEFVQDAMSYHIARWERENISVNLVVDSDFKLKFSPGKFSQVIDNLALNSEYWLRRSLAQGQISSGVISVSISDPVIVVSDNGPGIPGDLAGSVFDPFVTSKPAGEGRGLGLFVVNQLLDSEGASISLSARVNGRGNFDSFVADFSGSERG